MISGLTISQAADFASVTVKTVRHYHRLGLIREPRRDRSGYRRYGSSELLKLLQVRALAEAGVPLAEIRALLGANPDKFAADLAVVKQRLTDRIQELVSRRDMLDRLAAGNRLLLPDRAYALLGRGIELGFPADFLATCQEGLILVKALVPDFDAYLTQVEECFEDTRYIALLKRSWEAVAWDLHDPRVEELATAFAELMLANPKLAAISISFRADIDFTTRNGLINDYQAEIAPAVARLSALTEAKLRSARATPQSAAPDLSE